MKNKGTVTNVTIPLQSNVNNELQMIVGLSKL